ncbi:MAG: class I SAM-dependent methyltransferase [Burkholderiales bacterium]|nr:class I SAM-dependent methyltransferase [Burkholderiales bacterium]
MEKDKQDLAAYYAQRAAHYDEIYQRPERQEQQQALLAQLTQLTAGQNVLELACGTGYWTQAMAQQAKSVLALDINPEMLAVATQRQLDPSVVRFQQADICALPDAIAAEKFSVCVAAFWWSHVKRAEQDAFIQQLRAKVGSACQLVLIDNCYVEGDSTPIARTDSDGNTYQFRKQVDGSTVEIVKNFPSDSNLRKRFASLARDVRVHRAQHFWLLTCRLK